MGSKKTFNHQHIYLIYCKRSFRKNSMDALISCEKLLLFSTIYLSLKIDIISNNTHYYITAERSFSTLYRLKTYYFRNTIR